jgi:3-hydroxyacyl-CoA dehydrogenase
MDDAMRWGFGHEAGPFETWDALGVADIVPRMAEAGFPPASWVKEMLENGFESFYSYEGERKTGIYNPLKGEYETVERSPAIIVLKEQKDAGKLVSQNASASIVDLGDGVICVEFQTKMNALDEYIIQMLNEALDRTEKGEFEGIVVGNDADHFCAGANVFAMVMAAQNGLWEQLDGTLKKGQDTFMRMRYSPKPVVVAPVGYTFGGGCEIVMHGSRVVSSGELYIGQTEIGFGLIPAGGGIKELLRRIVNPAMQVDDAPVLPFMQKIFNLVGQGKFASSAVEARQFGFLNPEARIVMNRDHLLAEAKREVLHLIATGYHPPMPEKIYAAGRDTLAALRAGVHMFKEGQYITEYESQVGERMIKVMTGGEMSSPTWVDEQYILDLEREAFLSLCGEEKTRERIWHFLRTGKMLRN